jgi:putative sugar O-methyltransferase
MKTEYLKSSISDTNQYRNVCMDAVTNDEAFQNFKKNPSYTAILEHVSDYQGKLYLDYIKNNSPELIENVDDFKCNDVYGGSIKVEYPEIGEISPSTLRYIKVLSDIKSIFGNIDGKKIIEIGAGYGGQCLIIKKFFKNVDYSIIDLDEASELAQKYLTLNKMDVRTIKISDLQFLDEDFDIVISNYAYSELNRTLQDVYYDKIIKRSISGYLTYNFISDIYNVNSYSEDELFIKFSEKNIKILDEYPKTFEKNIIIYFNNEF